VNGVVFSSDGKYIATASSDNTARVWDAVTGNKIYILNHDGSVNNVAFSSDGKYIATASRDNTARLWVLSSTEDLIKEASNSLTRNLTPEEWKKYMGDEPYHKTFPNLP
jgi:WD40 repeat protein